MATRVIFSSLAPLHLSILVVSIRIRRPSFRSRFGSSRAKKGHTHHHGRQPSVSVRAGSCHRCRLHGGKLIMVVQLVALVRVGIGHGSVAMGAIALSAEPFRAY